MSKFGTLTLFNLAVRLTGSITAKSAAVSGMTVVHVSLPLPSHGDFDTRVLLVSGLVISSC